MCTQGVPPLPWFRIAPARNLDLATKLKIALMPFMPRLPLVFLRFSPWLLAACVLALPTLSHATDSLSQSHRSYTQGHRAQPGIITVGYFGYDHDAQRQSFRLVGAIKRQAPRAIVRRYQFWDSDYPLAQRRRGQPNLLLLVRDDARWLRAKAPHRSYIPLAKIQGYRLVATAPRLHPRHARILRAAVQTLPGGRLSPALYAQAPRHDSRPPRLAPTYHGKGKTTKDLLYALAGLNAALAELNATVHPRPRPYRHGYRKTDRRNHWGYKRARHRQPRHRQPRP